MHHATKQVYATFYRLGHLPTPILLQPGDLPTLAQLQLSPPIGEEETHIYVCTHGARDCRCGTTGVAVFRALKAEAGRLGRGGSKRVRVREISHVGGHKWAANVLVYPPGDWYGLIRPGEAGELLARVGEGVGVWAERWRGRMGFGEKE
ncbi:hypothetical protein DACRYDRAFT_55826, partial [Dacryopinax primogenitus]